MKKKDFELIASVIRDDDFLWRALHGGEIGKEYREKISFVFAEKLAETNPRFDKTKFLLACGIKE